MSSLISSTPLLPALPDEPVLQTHYELKLSELEVYFLGGFIGFVISLQIQQQLLLERAVTALLHRRYADRWSNPKACKIKLTAAEAIALKRVLEKAPADLDLESQVYRNNLLGKLQQQMPRIQ